MKGFLLQPQWEWQERATTPVAVSWSAWGREHRLVGSPGWEITKWLLATFSCGERRSWAQGSCNPWHIFVRAPGAVWVVQCTQIFRSLIWRVACGILTGSKLLCLLDKMSFCPLLPASFVHGSATMVWYLLVSSIHSVLLLFVRVFWRRGFWIFCRTVEMWLWKHLKALMTSLQMIRFQINNVLNSKNMYCLELWARWSASHPQYWVTKDKLLFFYTQHFKFITLSIKTTIFLNLLFL